MYRAKLLPRLLPPLLLGLSLFAIYLRTLASGLAWANGGSDGGDLITAAATGGIPHPSGYPLYLLSARLFQLLPVGSLAFRTNLMSAVFAVLAALLAYEIVHRSQSPSSPQLGALVAGYAFGLAPLVWSQAVITEVYTLQAFLTACILYLYTVNRPASVVAQQRLDGWRGLALGLAMGNHLTTLLLVPAAFLIGSVHQSSQIGSTSARRLDAGAFLRQLGAFFVGLTLYLILPLRALAHPPISWGNVVTLPRLWWLVSGQLYQSYYFGIDLPAFWRHLQASAGLLIGQFGLPGLFLGSMGLIFFGRRSALYALTGWAALSSLVFAIFYLSADSYVYLIPAFLSFAVWIGHGLEGLLRPFAARFPRLQAGLGLILIAYFFVSAAANGSRVDASQDLRAETFGREALMAAPQNAIVFAKGDEAVFTLWYFHFALHERPDLVVLAQDLLHFDWYEENLRHTYPQLVLPGPFPWPETIVAANPLRPTCYVQYADPSEISCTAPGSQP